MSLDPDVAEMMVDALVGMANDAGKLKTVPTMDSMMAMPTAAGGVLLALHQADGQTHFVQCPLGLFAALTHGMATIVNVMMGDLPDGLQGFGEPTTGGTDGTG